MIFTVTRTSIMLPFGGSNEPPCKEAYLKKGSKTNWEIEINSLEELIELSKKYGKIIVNGNEIEIYDYFRE